MTVLVDTSAWVEYLRATGSAHHHWLRRATEEDRPLAWSEPVLFELLVGTSSPDAAVGVRNLLLRGPALTLSGLQDWEDAAALHRRARGEGYTVRSTADCLIAAVAIRTSTPLLAKDRDFAALAAVSNLQLVAPELGEA